MTSSSTPPSSRANDPTTVSTSHGDNLNYNLRIESAFAAFNGIVIGLVVFSSPIVALTSLSANKTILTLVVSAFPVGAFLGPLWASVGRRWGMQRLVCGSSLVMGALLLLMSQVNSANTFALIIVPCQLACIAVRMGQSSLYGVVYPREQRGRVIGRFAFYTYLAMIPSMILTGWALRENPQAYRILYPLTGLAAFFAAFFYQRIRVPPRTTPRPVSTGGMGELRKVGQILKRDRAFRLFEMGFFLTGSSFLMSYHVVMVLTQEKLGYDALQLTLWRTVVPQLILVLGSPFWGRFFDRLGMAWSRLLVSTFIILYLGSYYAAFLSGVEALIFLGSIMQGLAQAGANLTWFLASSYFAPDSDDVPTYNTIHFFLNGARGLLLPLTGSLLLAFVGANAVVVAIGICFSSIPLILRLRRYDRKTQQGHSEQEIDPGANHANPKLSAWRRTATDARLQPSGGATAESEARHP